jgi:hypothetical protein
LTPGHPDNIETKTCSKNCPSNLNPNLRFSSTRKTKIYKLVTGKIYKLVTDKIYKLVTGKIYKLVTGKIYKLVTGKIYKLVTGKIYKLVTCKIYKLVTDTIYLLFRVSFGQKCFITSTPVREPEWKHV